MLLVDQRRERRLGGVIEFAGRRFTARILRRGDNLKAAVLQLFVDFLPAWQIA